jgi:hypothetical protein
MNPLDVIAIILAVNLREKIDQELKKYEDEVRFTWGM